MSIDSGLLCGFKTNSFMYPSASVDPVRITADIRKGIDELPDTCATFKLSRVTEYDPKAIDDRWLWLCGSWRLPARYREMETPVLFVNPNNPHRREYADIGVACECGGYIVHEQGNAAHRGEFTHTDSCNARRLERARDDLRELRCEWLETSASLWIGYKDAAPRLGVHPRYMSGFASDLGYSYSKLRKHARVYIAATWRELRAYGYSSGQIADAYGSSSSTVREYIRTTPELAVVGGGESEVVA